MRYVRLSIAALAVGFFALISPGARASATIDFEPPGYLASPSGINLVGQDGWTLPTQESTFFQSASPGVFSGSGNAIGISSDSQFAGLLAGAEFSSISRADFPVAHQLDAAQWTYKFDVCVAPDPSPAAGRGTPFFSTAPRALVQGDPHPTRDFSLGWTWVDNNSRLATFFHGFDAAGNDFEFQFPDTGAGNSGRYLIPGTWYSYEIDISPALNQLMKVQWTPRGTFPDSFFFGGSAYLAGGAASTLPPPDGIRLNDESPTTAVGFDNIIVDVPEPAACLIAFPLAAFLRRRRRAQSA